MSITAHKNLKKLNNVKIVNLKVRIGIKKVSKQDEDTGNFQVSSHLRSLF